MQIRNELILGSILALFPIMLTIQTGHTFNEKTKQSPSTPIPVTSFAPTASTVLTREEIAKHATQSDCWMIVENGVYNVSPYISIHPGGTQQILPYCGKDGTQAFATQGGRGSHSNAASQDLSMLKLGNLNATVQQKTIEQTTTSLQNITPKQRRENEWENDD